MGETKASMKTWRVFVTGFLAGIFATIAFFYFDGWERVADKGADVKQKVRTTVEDAGDSAKDKGEDLKKKAGKWLDAQIKD